MSEKKKWLQVILKILAVVVLVVFWVEPWRGPRRPDWKKVIKVCNVRRVVYEGAVDMYNMDNTIPMESGIIVYGNGSVGPLGEKLIPKYVLKQRKSWDKGFYYYNSDTKQVLCSVHKREEYPPPRPQHSHE